MVQGASSSRGEVWSGLETPGMKEARCSLLLPRDITHDARVTALTPQTVQVFQDKDSLNLSSLSLKEEKEASFTVDFKGATILQLEPTIIEANTVMPVTITIGGRVVLTPENYEDFRVMMRTKQQSEEMRISSNGSVSMARMIHSCVTQFSL